MAGNTLINVKELVGIKKLTSVKFLTQMQSLRPQKVTACVAETCRRTYRSLKLVHPFFCTAHSFYPVPKSYALQCFSVGQTPQKCPFPWGASTCNTCSLDPPYSATQHPKLHVNWFSHFHTAHARVPILYNVY